MKRILLSFFTIAIGQSLFAQNVVTTLPQYKSAVLEEYTGIYCQFCPDGHLRAKQMKADYPGRVVLVNIHQGSYANPQGNHPDFRTTYGNALAAQTNLTGYPTGTINRRSFSDISGNNAMAISRTLWRLAGEEVMGERSPVSLGAATSYDASTRTLTIDLEAYYSSDAANSYNLVNIALIQDSLIGHQTGASTYNPGDVLGNGQYVHGHMLRDLITGQWGDTISNTVQGSLFSKTYTYTLPNNVRGNAVVPSNCHLAIYVTEGRTDITQGITLGLNDSNDGATATYYGEFSGSAQTVAEAGGSTASFSFDLEAAIAGDYIFTLSSDAPSDWSTSYTVGGTTYNSGDTISLPVGMAPITLQATPGNSNALAELELIATPVSDTSVHLSHKKYVIEGVTDLIVRGSGSYADGNTYDWSPMYLDAFTYTGSDIHAATSAEVMMTGFNEGAFTGIENLYLDIGWTFPTFSDQEATQLMNFMDAGGNLFVSGQDIGWDINSGNGSGSFFKRRLYRNYLKASWEADGDNANQSIHTSDTSDMVYGGINSSTLSQPYVSGFYPDEIAPLENAKAVFNYNGDTTKTAGIRWEGNYKMVYLGVGLEMISDTMVRKEIIRNTYGWFHNSISTKEFDARMSALQMFPNPSSDGSVNFANLEAGIYTISVVNTTGKEVHRTSVEVNGEQAHLDLSHLPNGIYMVKARNDERTYSEKLIIE